MDKPLVKICHAVDTSGDSYRRMEKFGAKVNWKRGPWDANLKREKPEKLIIGADQAAIALVANRTLNIDSISFKSAPDLRIVAYYSNGYDNVDLVAASDRGILVTNSPTEANWGGVAEGTFAGILCLLKKLREKDRMVKEGGWRDPSLFGTYLGARISDGYEGVTIGIIGLGRIGSRLADLFAPWRVKIFAHDPYIEDSKFVHHNVKSVGLDRLIRESDVITLHCDLNDDTKGIISVDAIENMKSSAIVVNAARGPCVDLDALIEGLKQNKIAGAMLDVLTYEPPDPHSPLLGLQDKVLLSPHMVAANRGGGLIPAIPWVEAAVLAALRGQLPKYVVNADAIPLWQERFSGKSLL